MKKALQPVTRRRSPGRPPLNSLKIDADVILQRGLELTRTIPLQDLSVVRVAKEFGVTAASIRYYLRGRDALTSGIVILFYRELLAKWPRLTSDWKRDITAVATLVYRAYLEYPGIAAYFSAENRFRILSSAIRADRRTMSMFLEKYFSVVRTVGLDPERTANYGVILLQLLNMAAHATARHQWPAQHKSIANHLNALDPTEYPSTALVRESYLTMAGETAFAAALDLVVSGLEQSRTHNRRHR
jgi:AcrR family transcriptional regulator